MTPGKHPQEEERLRELRRYGILDTERERDFDEIVELASELCGKAVSVVNFIDDDRQWFKAEVGLGVRSTPLDTSLCGHVILQDDFVEIPDTLADPRMADNPLCTEEPGFRFYAGAVLKGANGLPLGTLCVLDHRPGTLNDTQRRVLKVLARQVMRELDLRLSLERETALRREIDHRVKNSLASLGAILAMQARRSDDPAVRAVLEEAGGRVRALASLHAELHGFDDGRSVDISSLFNRVETDFRQLLPKGIQLAITVKGDRASAELANALLLTVNEFVSNALKHGFPDGTGTIAARIAVNAEGWSLVCSDNGGADAEAADRAAAGAGLGTRVIASLAHSIGAQPAWRAVDGGMQLTLRGERQDDS